MAVFPFIFAKKGVKMTDRRINHEKIHLRQEAVLIIVSLLILIPAIWYFSLPLWMMAFSYSTFYILWFIFYLIYGYRNIPFEKEAYDNDNNLNYLDDINLFAWVKYLL